MFRVLVGGFICGVFAVLVFHQGTQFLLYHNLSMLNALTTVPEGLRPPDAGFVFRLVPPLRVPYLLTLCFFGGVWGLLLASVIRYSHFPDLITGLLFGAVICSMAGFSYVPGTRTVPFWDFEFSAVWAQHAIINGAWGWGAAGVMRALGITDDRP